MKINMTDDILKAIMSNVLEHSFTGIVNAMFFDCTNRNLCAFDAPADYVVYVKNMFKDDSLFWKRLSPMYSAENIATIYSVVSQVSHDAISSAGFDKTIAADIYATLMTFYTREMKLFSKSDIEDNPYVKNIRFDGAAAGDFEYMWQDYKHNELHMYDMPRKIGVCDIARLGMFIEPAKYPSIFQKSIGRTWMSVTPNEINTMAEPIKHAHGKVLTLGLGMGYFAYMASLKDDVESIDIIEIDSDVIKLFEDYILPQFEFKNKIHIINEDAARYLDNYEDGTHDYCFADTWLGADDFKNYFEIKEMSRRFVKTKFEYWIEKSFMSYLSGYLWIMILQRANISNAAGDAVLDDRFLRYMDNLYKHVTIDKPGDINRLMSLDDIARRVARTQYIF